MRLAAAAMILTLAGCAAPAAASLSVPATVAGTIRFTDGEWYLLDDDTHEPIGVESVTTEGGTVTIHFDFDASQVVTFIATPDETMAAAGYSVGASVGLDRAVVTVAPSPGELPETANVWFYGLLES